METGPEPEPEPEPSGGGGESTEVKKYFEELLKEVVGELADTAVDMARDKIIEAATEAKANDPGARIPWWTLIGEQMTDFDYPSDDSRSREIIQVNMVVALQTWLQEHRPKAVAASDAYFANWPTSSRKQLTIDLIRMDTVPEMAKHMRFYTGPDGQQPPFICGSTPLLDAVRATFS